MNGGSIMAQMGDITTTGNKVITEATSYASLVKKIYSAVDDLSSKWQGTDTQAYIEKVKSYQADIENLGKAIESYGQFLKQTATTYQNTRDSIASAAGRL